MVYVLIFQGKQLFKKILKKAIGATNLRELSICVPGLPE